MINIGPFLSDAALFGSVCVSLESTSLWLL